MVPVIFLGDLADELGSILSHIRLPNPSGGRSGINIFQYGLPMEKTREDSKKKFPYVFITPLEGNITGEGTEPQKMALYILIGVYDDDMHNRGKDHVLNIINDICERFSRDPVLKGKYYADAELKWIVDDEEEYPFHYGAVWMTFNIPAFGRREDKFA